MVDFPAEFPGGQSGPVLLHGAGPAVLAQVGPAVGARVPEHRAVVHAKWDEAAAKVQSGKKDNVVKIG